MREGSGESPGGGPIADPCARRRLPGLRPPAPVSQREYRNRHLPPGRPKPEKPRKRPQGPPPLRVPRTLRGCCAEGYVRMGMERAIAPPSLDNKSHPGRARAIVTVALTFFPQWALNCYQPQPSGQPERQAVSLYDFQPFISPKSHICSSSLARRPLEWHCVHRPSKQLGLPQASPHR